MSSIFTEWFFFFVILIEIFEWILFSLTIKTIAQLLNGWTWEVKLFPFFLRMKRAQWVKLFLMRYLHLTYFYRDKLYQLIFWTHFFIFILSFLKNHFFIIHWIILRCKFIFIRFLNIRTFKSSLLLWANTYLELTIDLISHFRIIWSIYSLSQKGSINFWTKFEGFFIFLWRIIKSISIFNLEL